MNDNKTKKIIKLIIKCALLLAVLSVISWLTLRSCWQKGSDKVNDYSWTEDAASMFGRHKLTVNEYIDYNDNATDRIFYISNIRRTVELDQVQFTLRYNENFVIRNNISKDLNQKIGDYEKNSSEGEKFCFVLCDNKGNKYTEYSYLTDNKMMYGFYRVIFDGIDFEGISELTVRIYLVKDSGIDEKDIFDTCKVWYSDSPVVSAGLSDDEKSAVKPTPDMMHYSVNLNTK